MDRPIDGREFVGAKSSLAFVGFVVGSGASPDGVWLLCRCRSAINFWENMELGAWRAWTNHRRRARINHFFGSLQTSLSMAT